MSHYGWAELAESLDRLLAAYLFEHWGALPSQTNALELMAWARRKAKEEAERRRLR